METNEQYITKNWMDSLTERQQVAINLAREYVADYKEAGIPGHSLILLVAKLADMLDAFEEV